MTQDDTSETSQTPHADAVRAENSGNRIAMILSDGQKVTQAELDAAGGKSKWCFKEGVSAVADARGRHTRYPGGPNRF